MNVLDVDIFNNLLLPSPLVSPTKNLVISDESARVLIT